MGERLTSNQNVAGSIPVIRTVAGSGVGFQSLTVNQVVGSSILLGHLRLYFELKILVYHRRSRCLDGLGSGFD